MQTIEKKDSFPLTTIACVVWLLGSLFFLCDYFARISPSVMTDTLTQQFHLSALSLGALSGCFFLPIYYNANTGWYTFR